MESIVLDIEGMHCGGCVGSIKKALEAVAGVKSTDVVLVAGTAAVTFDPTLTGAAGLGAAVVEAGYAVRSGSTTVAEAVPARQCGDGAAGKTGCGCG